MKYIVLKDLIQFTAGKNATRIKDQQLYTPEDFEKDLYNINNDVVISECVINLMKSKAAPLLNGTKCITSNFLKCTFDTDILDPWFFCYQFNIGIEQQINMLHQGTTLSVKKLNIKNISELKISLPDIKRQKRIGALYRKAIIRKSLMIRQAENMEKLTLEIIKKYEED